LFLKSNVRIRAKAEIRERLKVGVYSRPSQWAYMRRF